MLMSFFYFETANISTQRTTTDKDKNSYGYKLIDFCKANSFSGVSNFIRRRSFYKLCLRKELLCYYWNQFGGRVHVGGRRCFREYSIHWIIIDINCGSKCVCKILKNIFIMEISLCGNKLCRFTFCFQLITT